MVTEILVAQVKNGFVVKFNNGDVFVTDKLPQVVKLVKAAFEPKDDNAAVAQ